MRAALIILTIVVVASAAPKATKLNARNLYKPPIAPPPYTPPGRIIGGQEATPHSIPYQVFLEIYDVLEGWYCGGSLISQNYVLTAGHCGDGAIEAYVTLGAHRPLENEDTQVQAYSTSITVHENYDGNQIINDIAVIRLPSSVRLTDAIQPIALPSQSDASNTFAGDTARVSGWGLTSGTANDISRVLNYVDVEVMTNRDCEAIFGRLESSILCTSGSRNTGTCSGDSGGPLTYNGYQIGIVSFGVQDCPRGYPSAFTRVTSFLSWLSSHTDA